MEKNLEDSQVINLITKGGMDSIFKMVSTFFFHFQKRKFLLKMIQVNQLKLIQDMDQPLEEDTTFIYKIIATLSIMVLAFPVHMEKKNLLSKQT
jgi:hypothetical protein